MRDGKRIAVNVHRPDAEGKFLALYAVSPYGKDNFRLPEIASFRGRENGKPDWWAERGYVYVHADTRGAFQSEGVWKFFDHREQEDMYDTIEWIAAQPCCTGKIGMIGESYHGAVQWAAATQNPSHLVCIAPYDAFVDPYRDLVFHGGIFSLAFTAFLTSEVKGPKKLAVFGDVAKIGDILDVPDYLLPLHVPQYIFASPYLQEELLRWYDYWLKGIENGIMDEPPVKYIVRPSGEIRWTSKWPIPDVRYRELYLGAGRAGVSNSLNDGRLSWQRPVGTANPTKFSCPQTEWGGWAGLGRAVYRPDGPPGTIGKILTFISEPLEEDLEVTGPIVQ
jgi:predicted acyl esterase